ncbi:MAG TPA: FtsW/RodA/SpoVE family cell cycle protein [Candidatus Cottocaccamicrobium excrementipullorum]|nr:FtsW/RodA/SpoVE family cell cycle protein [Candidatus Cottocaccamicrobium excrementipullorum]
MANQQRAAAVRQQRRTAAPDPAYAPRGHGEQNNLSRQRRNIQEEKRPGRRAEPGRAPEYRRSSGERYPSEGRQRRPAGAGQNPRRSGERLDRGKEPVRQPRGASQRQQPKPKAGSSGKRRTVPGPSGASVQAAAGRQDYLRQSQERAAAPQGKTKTRRFYDYSLMFAVIFLTVFGLVMIYSSSSYSAQLYNGDAGYFMKRQALIAMAGFVAMVVISKMNYHFFARFALLGYGLSYVFLLMVMLTPLGVEANGKKRWLALGPVQFQPTEMVKIALILLLAVMITKMGNKINTLKGLLTVAAVTIPIAGLVAMNNLSSGIIIVGIAFVVAFVASKLKWPFALCTAAAGVIFAFAGPIATALEKIGLVQAYQLNRIHVWLQPEAYPQDGGYQVLQGLYAIGSGGLMGKGLGESIQKLGFIPEAQNDMVFSVICEELGLFGAVSVILIFLFMIYRFMLIASNAPDLFGALLVVGVMGHIAIQVILNIAVVTNTIPNTGITLPFISYGGTSVMFLMMEMGIVLSVSNQIKLQK